MKFAIFSLAEYEREDLKDLERIYNIDFDCFDYELAEVKNDIDLSIYDGISTIGIKNIPNEIIDRLSSCKVIALRSIGYQYIDIKYCKSKGIIVTNAKYSPYNVADFAIMLMLMCLRNAKLSICRALVNDFSLDSMCGSEMRNQVVGIIGTGKIGKTVIKQLSGFGCKIYCHDLYEDEEVKKYAEYKDLNFIYQNCTLISLHVPLTDSNFHMIDEKEIEMMKDGVILINTARGPLTSIKALIKGIEEMKIGALGLDTIEGEEGLTHKDLRASLNGLASKKDIMYLKQFPNVILTQHVAFFTKEATRSMVECSIKAIWEFRENKEIENKVN